MHAVYKLFLFLGSEGGHGTVAPRLCASASDIFWNFQQSFCFLKTLAWKASTALPKQKCFGQIGGCREKDW